MDKKYSLLIVDDERDIVDMLFDYFRGDYTVHKAFSAEEGLEILEDNQIHLVMTDQRMAEMQGTELLAKLKEDKPDITRILMTGYTDLEAAIEAINEGSIHRYLTKPLDFEKLGDIIAEGLEHHEEAVKVKNLINAEKDNIIGKIKDVMGHIQDVESDRGELETELQAAKDIENKMRKDLEDQIENISNEKRELEQKITEYEEKISDVEKELEDTRAEAEDLKKHVEENDKLKSEMKEIEARFLVVNKASSSLKADNEKIKQELAAAIAEKGQIEKKLKQFQANWAKSMAA